MALIQTITGTEKPAWLASENGMRVKTATGTKAMGTKDDATGSVTISAGTIYPTNDTNAEGIVFQDVDVSKGDYPISIMTAGFVYEDRLPVTLDSAAKTALAAKGVHFESAPEFERLY